MTSCVYQAQCRCPSLSSLPAYGSFDLPVSFLRSLVSSKISPFCQGKQPYQQAAIVMTKESPQLSLCAGSRA